MSRSCFTRLFYYFTDIYWQSLYCRHFSLFVHFANKNTGHRLPFTRSADQNRREEVLYNPYQLFTSVQNVFVIQPIRRVANSFDRLNCVEWQLAEAVALVHCIPDWRVADTSTEHVNGLNKDVLFGFESMFELSNRITANKSITSVFVNLNQLTFAQHEELEKMWHLPIVDRYALVLSIFRAYSKSKETEYQIALAELSYLRSKAIKKSAQAYSFRLGEARLKAKLLELQGERGGQMKSKRSKQLSHVPTIAVLGYTNAGKTSLVRKITDDLKLQPKDRLFATLSISTHECVLPSQLRVLFADTVGFIQDIPFGLIASFQSTLRDALDADMLIHVRDVSDPAAALQKLCVVRTLQKLQVTDELLSSMIEVCNKVDLLREVELGAFERDANAIFASCVRGDGISQLLVAIDAALSQRLTYASRVFKVPMSGQQWSFLSSETCVQHVAASDDCQWLFVRTLVDKPVLSKFIKQFGNLEVRENNLKIFKA